MPFAEGKRLAVDIPINPRGTTDVYIDNMVGLTLGLPGTNNVKRLGRSGMLAIHTAAIPKHKSEPIVRKEMAALNNFSVYGVKMCHASIQFSEK